MIGAFYLAGAIAVLSTVLALTRLNAVHALLYLVVSLLALGVVFYTLGAPFIAALEVIVYAGAIMVLFVFVVMMLNLGERSVRAERELTHASAWIGPALLSAVLAGGLVYLVVGGASATPGVVIGPVAVGAALFGPYALGVELASMLLLSGLVGAFHLGRRPAPRREIVREVPVPGSPEEHVLEETR